MLNIIFISLIFISIPSVIKKKKEIESFLGRKDFKIILPYYYTIGNTLEIRFPEVREFSEVSLVISNTIFEIKDERFILSEKWTKEESLSLKIYVKKFGITRLALERKISGTTRFLPVELKQLISYPGNLLQTEVEGLNNLEVYPEAIISISGKMSKRIKSISLNIPSRKIEINNENFKIVLIPKKSQIFYISLLSIYDEKYLTGDLKIKIIENIPPTIAIEFPTEDIILRNPLWKLVALISGSDDQGIARISVDCLIENEDKNLSFLKVKKSFDYKCEGERELQKQLSFTSKEIELLPGDRATFYVKAFDLFGKASKTKSFSIYSPDFEWIEKMVNTELAEIKNILTNFSSLSGENPQTGIKKEKYLKDLAKLKENLNEVERLFSENQNPEEAGKIIEKMKEISDKLEEILKDRDEFLISEKEGREILNPRFENIEEYLWQMERLIDALNVQKETLKKAKFIDEIKNLLESIKNEMEKEKFDRKLEAYKKLITSKKDTFTSDEQKRLLDELLKEADNIKFNDKDSFLASEEILKKLSESLQNSTEKRNNLKKVSSDVLLFMIEETVLSSILINETSKKISGSIFDEAILAIKSVKSSIQNIKKIYREKLGFYFLIYKDFYKPLSIIEKISTNIFNIEESMREKRIFFLYREIPLCQKELINLYFSLKDFINFLDSPEFENQLQSPMTISIQELVRMQQMVTAGLEKMLSEKKGNPEYQRLKDELARLQKSINKNFGQLLKDGAFSGGREIMEELEKTFQDIIEENVSDKTVERSRKLEEKLLKSRKGLQNKGVDEERKAERPSNYVVSPPENIILKPQVKKEFHEITNQNIPFYYRRIIENYKREMQIK
ncbi:MAG: hypothetical protein ACP5QT_07455 [Brevinematia bacterium]